MPMVAAFPRFYISAAQISGLDVFLGLARTTGLGAGHISGCISVDFWQNEPNVL
jgi:hypothetical protein